MALRKMRHRIAAQFKEDFKVARKLRLPWWSLVGLGVCSIPVFIALDHVGRPNMALPLLNSVGVIVFLSYLKRSLWRQPLFWVSITLFVAVHGLLVWYIPWTSKWVPALAIGGINSIDLCIMLWLLAAIDTALRSEATLRRRLSDSH